MLPASLSPAKVTSDGKVCLARKKKRKARRSESAPNFTRKEKKIPTEHENKKLWRSFLRKKERGGINFDTQDWYRKNVLHPSPAVKKVVKKTEVDELPAIALKGVTPVSSTPWDTRNGKRKTANPGNLLAVPTNLGFEGYNELMTGFETFEDHMKILWTRTACKNVSKQFLKDILAQDRRRRERDRKQAIKDAANEVKVQKVLNRLRHKEKHHCFEVWVELWRLMKQIKRLAHRVMSGTNSHTWQMWRMYVKECHKESMYLRRQEEARLFPFAQRIQALVRGVMTRQFLVHTRAARVIQRMMRVYHAKTIVKRAKARLAKEEAILRKFAKDMLFGKLVRVFDAFRDYVQTLNRIRRFCFKHMSETKHHCFLGWRQIAISQVEDRRARAAQVIQRTVRIYFARCILGRMKSKTANQEARVRKLLMHVLHGAMLRCFSTWADNYRRKRKFKHMMHNAKYGKILHLTLTWKANAHFVRRRRKLVKRLFLSAEKTCYYAWIDYHMEWQSFKAESAVIIQCFWRTAMAHQRAHKLRIERDILLASEKQKMAYAQEESWRHEQMAIRPEEMTENYKLISKEIADASVHCVGLFESKVLHDSFDLRRVGHIVMASLKEELVKENAFIVQRRDAEGQWTVLKHKLDTIRFYKEDANEKLAHEMHDIPQRSDHFPERTLPGAGDTIIWQGSLSENFELDLIKTLKEWMFMKTQGWISHHQYVQWVAKGLMENLESFEKREICWQVLRRELDPNLVGEIIVAFQNNAMMRKLKIPKPEAVYQYCKTGLDVQHEVSQSEEAKVRLQQQDISEDHAKELLQKLKSDAQANQDEEESSEWSDEGKEDKEKGMVDAAATNAVPQLFQTPPAGVNDAH